MSNKKWRISAGEIISSGPVVPVIVIDQLEHAVPLAKALMAGGIRVLEVTLRTPVALEAIGLIAREVPGALVGAGTVTNPDELKKVQEKGAFFAISPGLTDELLDAANKGSIPLIPGISTVSELMSGLAKGYSEFKFFPAEAAGGPKMLRAISGPFPDVRFCPTGGITLSNFRDYLCLGNVLCVGGSWLVPGDAVSSGDWQRITGLAEEALEKAVAAK